MSVVFFHIMNNSIFVHIHDFTWTVKYINVDDQKNDVDNR